MFPVNGTVKNFLYETFATYEVLYTFWVPFILLNIFFKEYVVLTPEPINIDGRTELILDEPIMAIGVARLRIRWVDGSKPKDVTAILEAVGYPEATVSEDWRLYPPRGELLLTARVQEVIKIKLSGRDETVTFSSSYPYSRRIDLFHLSFTANVPTFVKFNKLIIDSSIQLKDARIVWENWAGP